MSPKKDYLKDEEHVETERKDTRRQSCDTQFVIRKEGDQPFLEKTDIQQFDNLMVTDHKQSIIMHTFDKMNTQQDQQTGE